MLDPLEQELAALTPIDPSPTLEQNIARALAAQSSPPVCHAQGRAPEHARQTSRAFPFGPFRRTQNPSPIPSQPPPHDRLLLSAITTGLAAAIAIATLLLTDTPQSPSRPDPAFTLADTPRLLAQLGNDTAAAPRFSSSTSPGVPQ